MAELALGTVWEQLLAVLMMMMVMMMMVVTKGENSQGGPLPPSCGVAGPHGSELPAPHF